MGFYETIVILHPDLSEEEVDREVQALRDRLQEGGAEIADCEDWGKRRLAYTVKTQRYGFYFLIRYEAPPTILREFEHSLRINERALKFLTVRCRPGEVTPPDLLKEGRERSGEGDSSESRPAPSEAERAEGDRPEQGEKSVKDAETVQEESKEEAEA